MKIRHICPVIVAICGVIELFLGNYNVWGLHTAIWALFTIQSDNEVESLRGKLYNERARTNPNRFS